MRKIRITKSPKTGNQRDYSLAHRQVHYIGEGDNTTPVKNTMGAVPVSQANIEVEGGETVVGDVNRDGFLEHMSFVGKRHSEGGMPVNIPEGSFIFSDTRKLKIKDKEVLKEIFGLSHKSGGYTPAEIAKRYQINQYINDLKSPDTDAITKRSAIHMLANNMEKLGMLALVQESMKGFPDGVPAIAESVMAGLQPQGQPQMPEAMYGGMTKFQDAGETFNLRYTPQTTIYINNEPFQYDSHYDADYWFTGDIVTFKSKDGRYYKTNSKDLINRIKSGQPVDLGYKNGRVNRAYITAQPTKNYYDSGEQTFSGKNFKKGTRFWADGKLYQVEDPYAATKVSTLATYASNSFGIPFEVSPPGTTDSPALKVLEVDRNTGATFGNHVYLPSSFIDRVVRDNTFDFQNFAGVSSQDVSATQPGVVTKIDTVAASAATKAPENAAPKQKATSAPVKKSILNTTPMSTDQMMQSFEKGGELDSYQDAGQTQPSGEKSNTKPDPNAEILVTEFTGRDGKKYYGYYKGNQKIIKDSDGNVVETRVRPAAETSYSQYGLPNIKQILDKTPGVTYSEINFGSFGRQSPMGNTGIYLSSTNSVARSRGDLSENEWNDFKKRHGDWIDIEYEGGFEQFKKDLLKSKAVGDKAAEWFQNEIDKKSIEKFGVSYFSDASTSGSSPYKRDGKFGMVTYSVPRFFNPAPVTTTANSQVKPPPAQSPTQTDDKQEEPAPMRPRRQGPWWLQDIVNFTGALTDRVNRYEPTQSRIDLQTPGYALLDPTRQLAANQEQMARLQDQAMNTTDGNVAMASMLGASGQGFGNAANVLADIENRNIGIVNRAYMGNAQIENQEAFANENARQKYVADMATLNQQVDNANQQKKWRQIAAFNNGTTNWFRKKQMEQVLFPQVYIDPIMGDAEFSGQGRDFFGPDTYLPAYMTPGNTNLNPDAVYKDAYDRFLPEVGDSQAKKLAERAYANALLQQSRQFQGTSPQQNFNWMAGQGLTLPAPLGRQEYGGEMYLPWVELD